MSIVGTLIGFGLRQALEIEGDQLIGFVEHWFTDHSQTLPRALGKANDRAWEALAIALAGDGFLDQIKVMFASGDDKGIREQVSRFLAGKSIQFEGTPADFRKTCLGELRQARKAGLLSAEKMSPAEVTQQTANFQRFADATGLVNGAWQTVAQIADALSPQFHDLPKLLSQPLPGGPPLLVAAFAYFFRREVETDDELANGLLFDGLWQLSAAQAKAFVEVGKALASLGDQFDRVIEQLSRIETVVVRTEAVAVATHGAVLDIQVELQRLGSHHSAGVDEMRGLLKETMGRLAQIGMQSGEVRPHHSFSIRSEDDRQTVKQLLARFRQLSRDQQRQVPALLNGLGKLQIGAGDFAGAKQTFLTVAESVNDAPAKAEAHFNAYRAALEKRQWEEALTALKEAAALDVGRFAPFPLHRYQPKRILGAGGFGAAFLCHDRNFDEDVVVKTLHVSDIARSMADVFQEAKILRRLSHPAIIGVHECEYADYGAQTRPYIVMDYFPGSSLDSWVGEHGPLASDDLAVVAQQIAFGMKAAHDKGIFHRDLKPGNVLVLNEGKEWAVKIIDFGLALRKQTIETSMVVRSSEDTVLRESVAGTVKYAPPEQMGELKGVKPGPYSDVYSFGKLCCYILFKTTEPKSRHWSTIPRGLADLLEACLEERPDDRPANFALVLERLAVAGPSASRELPQQEESKLKSLELGGTAVPENEGQTETPERRREDDRAVQITSETSSTFQPSARQYTTSLREELELYERQFAVPCLDDVHLAPHTLEIAAMWSVLTRLETPRHGNVTLLQKLRLYNGERLPGFTDDHIVSIKRETLNEGRFGVSPGYTQAKISEVLLSSKSKGKKCVTPLMVLHELDAGLSQPVLIDKPDRVQRYKAVVQVVMEDYVRIAGDELLQAVPHEESQLNRLYATYTENVKAYMQREKVRNRYTGNYEEPDEQLMRSIEEKTDISVERKDDFRREVFNLIGALAIDRKRADYKTSPKLHQALALRRLDELKSWFFQTNPTLSSRENALNQMFYNYINNIKAYTNQERVCNPETGNYKEPDEDLMRSVEERLDISVERKDDFRREMMKCIGALTLKGKPLIRKNLPQLLSAFLQLYEERKADRKENAPDKGDLERVGVTKRRLVDEYGYCESCVTDLLMTLPLRWYNQIVSQAELAAVLEAAEQGKRYAQYQLGSMYQNGQGISCDYAQAARWYRKAADQGNSHAQYRLGEMIQNGQGVPQDHNEAAYWYDKAACNPDQSKADAAKKALAGLSTS